MKKLILIFCLGLFATGCKKSGTQPMDQMYHSQGTLIGEDVRTCVECGGLEVTITNDTTKNPPPFYLVRGVIPGGLPANLKFPANVSLDWRHDTTSLGKYRYILITKMKVLQ